ncbi:SPARC-related modular calcium-binding protein 2 [Carlito syrichta]|uniref:SPARC-related modular calcium-binding protein 2 n=1 Tax=Carlito syrichta TaxID=1868482 RepID=A0A3Q0DPF3_CARSF|nr:SPARC-related modular calcium-binding protein 2 [Carlito syrichta]
MSRVGKTWNRGSWWNRGMQVVCEAISMAWTAPAFYCSPEPFLNCVWLLFPSPKFLRVDQDKDKDCSLDCAGSPQKPLCASDGRTFLSRCEFQRAKCKDPQLEIAYRGNCKDVSRCVAERKYTQEQARKEFQQVFIPECDDDGTYSQVQCHSYTGYCWCVTPNGRPISGTAVAHKTPRCPGSVNEKLPQREGTGKTVSLQIFSVLNSDDAAAPALETQPQGDEEDIASRYPTLWTEQVKSRQNKTNKNSVSSCDQEHQSALEEAKQPKNDNVVIPECAHGGLYKPVQCHPSTGYCWCVLVDTGRPIPGTSTRYEQPKCDSTARAHPTKARDLYKGRQLHGLVSARCPHCWSSVTPFWDVPMAARVVVSFMLEFNQLACSQEGSELEEQAGLAGLGFCCLCEFLAVKLEQASYEGLREPYSKLSPTPALPFLWRFGSKLCCASGDITLMRGGGGSDEEAAQASW